MHDPPLSFHGIYSPASAQLFEMNDTQVHSALSEHLENEPTTELTPLFPDRSCRPSSSSDEPIIEDLAMAAWSRQPPVSQLDIEREFALFDAMSSSSWEGLARPRDHVGENVMHDYNSDVVSAPYNSNRLSEQEGSMEEKEEEESEAMRELHARFPWIRNVTIPETLDMPYPEHYLTAGGSVMTARVSNAPPLDDSVPVPTGIAFVNSLISLDMDELAPNQRHCPVCTETYLTPFRNSMPLLLPCCNKVLCQACCSEIFSLYTSSENQDCPFCRHSHVPQRAPINTMVGLIQFLQMSDYMLCRAGPLRLSASARLEWDRVKAFVDEYLREETEKLQREVGLQIALKRELASPRLMGQVREYLSAEEQEDLRREIEEAIGQWNMRRDPGSIERREVAKIVAELNEDVMDTE